MIDFIYYGEAKFYKENLDSFLTVAQELKLKGLENPCSEQESESKINQLQPKKKTPNQITTHSSNPHGIDIPSIFTPLTNVEAEPLDLKYFKKPCSEKETESKITQLQPKKKTKQITTRSSNPKEIGIPSIFTSLIHNEAELLEGSVASTHNIANATLSVLDEYITKDSATGNFLCRTCGKSSKQKNCIRMHIEAIHFPGQFVYTCSICNKTFNGKNSLTVHMARSHRQDGVAC